jgi:hypothetical protein
MSYYCFLCNNYHDDSPTEEHFIPKSIDGLEHQWLPVCQSSNSRSNLVFDNDARDILYWVRFKNTRALKRIGLALLVDGSSKRFKFSYLDEFEPERHTEFNYIFDRETNEHIPSNKVCAIVFPVGLLPDEQRSFCRGLAKISIGTLVYRLMKENVPTETIKQLCSQTSVNVLRHFALDLPWIGRTRAMIFSLGQSDVIKKLHSSCEKQEERNHVVKICLIKNKAIQVEGMLYSQYGWRLEFSNSIPIEQSELRLENNIKHMKAPDELRDLSLTMDAICIANPEYTGHKPEVPPNWRDLI